MRKLLMIIVASAVSAGVFNAAADGLPEGYTRLPYIKANKNVQVKTGYTPAATDKIVMTWCPTQVSATEALWCARSNTTKNAFTAFAHAGKQIGINYNNVGLGTGAVPASFTVNKRDSLVAYTKYTAIADGTAQTLAVTNAFTGAEVVNVSWTVDNDFTVGSELCLFASHTTPAKIDSPDNWSSHFLYSFKVYDAAGTLKLDLVPAKDASGVVGLYDTVGDSDTTGERFKTMSNGYGSGSGSLSDTLIDKTFDDDFTLLGDEVFGTLNLNGHKLYIDHTALNGVAAFIDSSSGEPGELHVSVAAGETVSMDAVDVSGNLKVVKEGAGCMLMRPKEIAVKCAEGRLDIGGRRPIHRWSFTDGSLADTGIVGGKTATEKGSGAKTYQDNAVTFAGGGNGTCYLDMGTDVIPSTGNVTIELWGKRDAATHSWASMFSIGVNANNNDSLRMAWSDSDAGDGKTDLVYLKKSGNIFYKGNTMSPYTVGTYYHISMRIVQNANGSAVFTWSKRNATTGAIEKTYTANVAASKSWSLARYAGNPFLLNSGYDNDDEAATYDEVRIWDCALSDDELTANAVAGPDAFPAENPRRTSEIVEPPTLLHRWSFTDGSLADSVGNSPATEMGSGTKTYQNNAVTFAGGGNRTCYLDMGTDVIPSTGNVTIELWGKRDGKTHPWASMFSIGVNGNNDDSLRMAWSDAYKGDGQSDMVYLKKGNSDIFNIHNSMTPYTVGTFYHISMRIVQNADGSAVFTWSKRNATTGAIERTYTENVAASNGWSLARYAGNPFLLNSGYANNYDEAATYDEVRIWGGALSDAQLTLNACLGPDKIVVSPKEGVCGEVEVAAGATLGTPADGVVCSRLSGAGTLVAASALTVEEALDIAGTDTGTFTVNGDLTLVGDWLWNGGPGSASDQIAGSGTFDISGATFVPQFANGATGVLQMADGVTITGYDQMAVPPSSKFKIKYTNGRLNLVRPGLMILIE